MATSNEPENAAETPASDDPKEQYKRALEQKKNRTGYGSQSQKGSSSGGGGSSAKAGGKREFRRKSG